METLHISFSVPTSWAELSDKQLRFVYRLIAAEFAAEQVQLLCLLRWSDTEMVGTQPNGKYLLKKNKQYFEATGLMFAEILPMMEWVSKLPPMPVRLSKVGGHEAIAADFEGVKFETYIMVDNLYQGYLKTQSDDLLDELAALLYPDFEGNLSPKERINVFYWVASLKDFFARRYPDFLQPASAAASDNLLGSAEPSVEDAMNAQIRALTKGDVTKEAEILALDTWRALTELNAQAKEYKQLKEQTHGSK